MRRYTRAYRTKKNVIETNALREQFMRQLSKEAEALLKQFSEQFNQTLQLQLTQAMQSIVPGNTAASSPVNSEPGSIASIGQLLSTGVRYLVSRPRTSNDTQESSRSIDASSSFKLSQSQLAQQMQAELIRGEKNS